MAVVVVAGMGGGRFMCSNFINNPISKKMGYVPPRLGNKSNFSSL